MQCPQRASPSIIRSLTRLPTLPPILSRTFKTQPLGPPSLAIGQTTRHRLPPSPTLQTTRSNTSSTSTPTATSQSSPAAPDRKPWRPAPHRDPSEPVYELYFTCKACKHRSGHTVSKQGYHSGTVLIRCDGCGNRHLIADHLKIFSDTSVTLEDLMRQKGEEVKVGGVGDAGDMEFWEDAARGKSGG